MSLFNKRIYFKLLFIFYIFINTLALGYFDISSNPLGIVVIVYGICIIVYDLYHKELIYNKNHLFLITLYGLLLFIATYMNKTYSSISSYMIVIMQLLIFILIFGHKKNMSLKTLKDELQVIIPFTCILVGIASLVSLMMYFTNVSYSHNGWCLGLVGDRLFGIYFNCNPASFLAIIVILLSFIAIKNNYRMKGLYVANIIIQLTYVILTQCRAAILILAIILTALLFYHFFRSKEMSLVKRIMINIAICICLLGGSFVLNRIAFIIPCLQGAIIQEDNRFEFDKIKQVVKLTLSGEVKNIPEIITLVDDISSGRVTLAKDSFKIYQQAPIHGIGAGNFRNMLVDITHNENIGKQILHTHNIFIESFVTTGIIGCFVMILFVIKTLFVSRDILIKYRNKQSYLIVLLMMMIYITEFIGGLFDFGVFYIYSLSATLGWMFLGYIYWLNDQPYYSLKDNSHIAIFHRYQLLSIDFNKEDFNVLKPEFIVINVRKEDDYIMTIKYVLGKSSFIFDVYYTLNINESRELEIKLAREFYTMIQDDIKYIYNQSSLL